MAYRPAKKQPQFADLKGILSQSKQTDNALYQTVQILIERLTQLQGNLNEDISSIKEAVEDASKEEPPTEPETGLEFDHYDSPLTDGDMIETNLIFANGECIIVQVPL